MTNDMFAFVGAAQGKEGKCLVCGVLSSYYLECGPFNTGPYCHDHFHLLRAHLIKRRNRQIEFRFNEWVDRFLFEQREESRDRSSDDYWTPPDAPEGYCRANTCNTCHYCELVSTDVHGCNFVCNRVTEYNIWADGSRHGYKRTPFYVSKDSTCDRHEKKHEDVVPFEPYTENDPEWGKGCNPEEPEES